MRDWEELAILQKLRQDQRQQEMISRYTSGQAQTPRQRQYRRARRAQKRIIRHLVQLGYDAHETTHNAPFDVWVGACRVEIKYSNWQARARRYQANVRHHQADVIIFDAVNGTDHFFIIPMGEVSPRTTLEINRYHVESYTGQWSPYLEQWAVLDWAISAAPDRPIQLGLGV